MPYLYLSYLEIRRRGRYIFYSVFTKFFFRTRCACTKRKRMQSWCNGSERISSKPTSQRHRDLLKGFEFLLGLAQHCVFPRPSPHLQTVLGLPNIEPANTANPRSSARSDGQAGASRHPYNIRFVWVFRRAGYFQSYVLPDRPRPFVRLNLYRVGQFRYFQRVSHIYRRKS